jgi:ribosomal protein S18 acetylase RimI-like enzyme
MGVIEPREIVLRDGRRVLLRTVRHADGPALAATWREIIPTTDMVLTSPGEFTLTDAEEAEMVEGWALHPASTMIGAFEGERPLGMLGLMAAKFRRTAHVVDLGMALRPEARGLGLGSALMQAAIAYAQANPVIERITLGVWSHNDVARRLYVRFGFQVEGYRVGQGRNADGRVIDEILMARRVKPAAR